MINKKKHNKIELRNNSRCIYVLVNTSLTTHTVTALEQNLEIKCVYSSGISKEREKKMLIGLYQCSSVSKRHQVRFSIKFIRI